MPWCKIVQILRIFDPANHTNYVYSSFHVSKIIIALFISQCALRHTHILWECEHLTTFETLKFRVCVWSEVCSTSIYLREDFNCSPVDNKRSIKHDNKLKPIDPMAIRQSRRRLHTLFFGWYWIHFSKSPTKIAPNSLEIKMLTIQPTTYLNWCSSHSTPIQSSEIILTETKLRPYLSYATIQYDVCELTDCTDRKDCCVEPSNIAYINLAQFGGVLCMRAIVSDTFKPNT